MRITELKSIKRDRALRFPARLRQLEDSRNFYAKQAREQRARAEALEAANEALWKQHRELLDRAQVVLLQNGLLQEELDCLRWGIVFKRIYADLPYRPRLS